MTQQRTVVDADPFIGAWQLDPAECEYEIGAPPPKVMYHIEADGQALRITIDWVGTDGRPAHLAYDSVPDGRRRPSPIDPTIPDTVVTERPDPSTLETTTSRSGTVVSRVRHSVSGDGQTLTLIETGTTEDGIAYRNISVYRRQSGQASARGT